MSGFHQSKPIWVWCYLTFESKHMSEREDMPPLSIWPHAHSYAFESEEEALAHPQAAYWRKVHGYVLQKVYLQTPPNPSDSISQALNNDRSGYNTFGKP